MIPLWLISAGKATWSVLRISIPIPIMVVLAAWLWVTVDKQSAVRKAVDDRVTALVAGAHIASLEAQRDAEAAISATFAKKAQEAERKLAAEVAARTEFEAKVIELDKTNNELMVDIDDILSAPPPPACVVTPDIARRLRD